VAPPRTLPRSTANRMGSKATYTCSHCGYSAGAGSGIDFGMAAAVATIACHQCKRLHDLALSEPPGDVMTHLESDPGWEPADLRCPRGKKHRVRIWRSGDGCPRCSEPLAVKPDGEFILWD
jgi:hypothetical protein